MDTVRKILDWIAGQDRHSPEVEQQLVSLGAHDDWEVKYQVMEKLGELCHQGLSTEAAAYLQQALSDKRELIRCQAVDVLSDYPYAICVDGIIRAMSDESLLVRTHAVEVLGWWGCKEVEPLIMKGIDELEEDAEKESRYFSLALLGHQFAVGEMLALLSSPDYLVQCSIANSIHCIVSPNNHDEIMAALRLALARAKTVAARSSLEECIQRISEIAVEEKFF